MSNSKADLREALREAYDEGDIDLDEWLSSRLSLYSIFHWNIPGNFDGWQQKNILE